MLRYPACRLPPLQVSSLAKQLLLFFRSGEIQTKLESQAGKFIISNQWENLSFNLFPYLAEMEEVQVIPTIVHQLQRLLSFYRLYMPTR